MMNQGQIYFLDPDTLESKLIGHVADKLVMIQPHNEDEEQLNGIIPTSKPSSYSFDVKMDKKTRKSMLELVRTRPDQAKVGKKHKWRLINKWFNRYQKPRIIGRISQISTVSGFIKAKIVDVKICKDGRHKVAYSYELKPII